MHIGAMLKSVPKGWIGSAAAISSKLSSRSLEWFGESEGGVSYARFRPFAQRK